jgi:hypothetical protein
MAMNTKLMTGVAAIALVLPALILDSTAAAARGAARGGGHAVSHAAPARGGGHAVSHASAPARVRRPSVARPAAVRSLASHANVAHAQPSTSIHTQAARPMEMIKRIGPNAQVSARITQPMHTSSGNASQLTNTSTGHTTNATLSGGTSGSQLPPFQASNATHAGANTAFPHPAVGPANSTGESKAQRITDLQNGANNAAKKAAIDTNHANIENKVAANDRNAASQHFAAMQSDLQNGNTQAAKDQLKAYNDSLTAANQADATASNLRKDAGIQNNVAKRDQQAANNLANGGGSGGNKPPKNSGGDGPGTKGAGIDPGFTPHHPSGGGSGTDTPKAKGGGSGTDTPKAKGGGSGDKKKDGDTGSTSSSSSSSSSSSTSSTTSVGGSTGGVFTGGVSTGGGSAAISGGAASTGSSTAAPTTAATTGSADTSVANAQSQCLVKITLPDNRVLFKDVCTGQWATTPPDTQPAQTQAR